MSIGTYLLLTVILFIFYKFFRFINNYCSEESKTKRAINSRRRQARKRDIFGKIKFIYDHANLCGERNERLTRGKLCLLYYNETDYDDYACARVWTESMSEDSLVFSAMGAKITDFVYTYCPGAWEDELEMIYRDAKKDFPNQLKIQEKRMAEAAKKKYGL